MPIPFGLRPHSIRRRRCERGVQEVLCRKNEALTPILGVLGVDWDGYVPRCRNEFRSIITNQLRGIATNVIPNNHSSHSATQTHR